MTRSEARNQKRKEVVEAIILRKESATLVARVYRLSLRNVFNWLARYRNRGWQALNDKSLFRHQSLANRFCRVPC